MKKLLLCLIAVTFYVHLHAQNNQPPDHFVIKGQVKNSPQPFVQLGVSGFMSMDMLNIPVTKDGSFSQTIPITHPRDFFIEPREKELKFAIDKQRNDSLMMQIDANSIRNYQNTINPSLTDKLLKYKSIEVTKELVKSPNAKIIITDGKSMMVNNIGENK